MSPPSRRQLILVFLVKLLLNIGRRFVYPFAPALSRELAVPVSAITSIIAAGQFSSLLGIFSGPLADRYGNIKMMRTGLLAQVLGMLLCGLITSYWVVFAGLILASLGRTIFDPALQAYIGANVPYQKRGRVMGFIETAWSGSTLIGIPLFGLVVEHYGLKASFWVIALLSALSLVAVGRSFRPKTTRQMDLEANQTGLLRGIIGLFAHRRTAGILLFAFCISLANDSLFVVYGLWFEDAFALSLVSLGFSTIAIGSAELLGELCTASLSDRIGLSKMISLCLACAIIAYLLLPIIGFCLTSAMAGLFCIFFFFEIIMVTSFSLSSELLPRTRATMMAGFYAVSGLGRMSGVFLASSLWEMGGIVAVALTSALCTALGFVFFRWAIHRWRPA